MLAQAGVIGLEDGLGRLPEVGKEADFRTEQRIAEAIKKVRAGGPCEGRLPLFPFGSGGGARRPTSGQNSAC